MKFLLSLLSVTFILISAPNAAATDCIFKWAYFSTKTLNGAANPKACEDLCLEELKKQFPKEWKNVADFQCYSIEDVSAKADKCLIKSIRSGREMGGKDISKESPNSNCEDQCSTEATKSSMDEFKCYSLVSRKSN